MDPQSRERMNEWEAKIRAAAAGWDREIPVPPPVRRIADEPLVSADTAAWLADWFAQEAAC